MAGPRWLRVSLVVFAAVLVLVVGMLALLPRLLDTPAIHAYISQTAAQVVGRPVKFASISVSLLPLPNVKLQGLEIADDPRFGAAPVIQVAEARLGVRVRPLLSLRVELASITLDGARIELVEDGGRWNVATLGSSTAPSRPSSRRMPGIPGAATVGSVTVSRIRLTDAAVHVRRRGDTHGELRVGGINVTVSGVGGADVDVRGDARVDPGSLKLSDIRATVGLRAPELPLKASFRVEGDDVGPLAGVFLADSPSVSGPVKGTLALTGTLAHLTATGAFDLSRVTISEDKPKCPPPARRQLVLGDVRVPVLLRPAALESDPFTANLGKGTVLVNVKVGLDGSPLVTLTGMKISGVELLPVLQGYLCQSFAVSGALDLGGELSMRTSDMWRTMNGRGRFAVGPGRVVGEGALALVQEVLLAGSTVDRALRGNFSGPGKTALEFEAITGTYRITNGVARTDDLLYRTKDLKVTATGTYALTNGNADMAVVITQSAGQFRVQVTGRGGLFRVVPTGVKVTDPEEVKKFLDRLLR
jgi:AsmA-like protein